MQPKINCLQEAKGRRTRLQVLATTKHCHHKILPKCDSRIMATRALNLWGTTMISLATCLANLQSHRGTSALAIIRRMPLGTATARTSRTLQSSTAYHFMKRKIPIQPTWLARNFQHRRRDWTSKTYKEHSKDCSHLAPWRALAVASINQESRRHSSISEEAPGQASNSEC